MTGLEVFLIIVITIWSLVFIAFGIALVFVLIQLKKALDKVNIMIDTAEEVTHEVGTSFRNIAAGIATIATKNLIGAAAKKFIQMRSGRKRN